MMKPPSIVLIEKESEARDSLMQAFENRGYLTWTCTELAAAITSFLSAQPDVLLIDLDSDAASVPHFLQAWKKVAPRTRVIVQTGNTSDAQRENVINCGVYAYLLKPVTADVLFEALNGQPVAPAIRQ